MLQLVAGEPAVAEPSGVERHPPSIGMATVPQTGLIMTTAKTKARPDFPPAGFIRRAGALMRAASIRLVDTVLPPRCVACTEPIERHDGLCAGCWAGVDFIQPPICDRLGIPLPFQVDDDGSSVSAKALADPPEFGRARAVARYSGVMRDLVHDLKYRDRHEGMALFTSWLANAGVELLSQADLLVPVPLHSSRLWRRRFNQSAMLAKSLGRDAGIPSDPFMLTRTKRTKSQVGLTAKRRARNVAGAFAVDKNRAELIGGRAIVLIDDVITTGATANACARALRRAGARSVDVLALARSVDPLAASQ